MIIAQYKFDNTLYDLFPTFNEGFTYTYGDIIEGEITTRTIYSNELPTKIQFGTNSESDKASSLVEVDYLNTSNLTTMYSMFKRCYYATKINASSWDTSKVTNMAYAFNDCQSLLTIDASNWDTGKVTDMESMFCRCYAENIENSIKNWDVSKVTNMKFMLDTTESIRHFDLSSWDVNSVIYLDGLFGWSYNLYTINLTGWNTSNVTSMTGMFTNCCSLTTIIGIEDLDISKVEHVTEDKYGIFTNCCSLTELDLSKWDVSNVTDMSNMFYGCQMLSSIGNINNWDTSNVTNMSYMFRDCTSLTSLDVSKWDTSKVTRMDHMFRDCNKLTSLDLNNFITNNVTDMSYMFFNCNKLTSLVLGNGFNMDNVTNIAYIFSGCNNLISLIVPNATISMKLDDYLPTRTADSPGTLIVTGDKYNLDTNTPASKYWNIVDKYKIAEYKFDGSLYNLIPDFNDGFIYTYEDKIEGNMITTNTNWESGVPNISTGIVHPCGEFPTAKVSDFIEVSPSTTYYTGTLLSEEEMKYNINVLCWYWYDENKTYIDGVIDEPSVVSPANASFLRVCIEESNLEYNGWTLNNVYVGTNTTSTITRTIYSDSLPTKIRFGSSGSATDKSNSLLACYYLNTSLCTFIQFDWTTRVVEINSSNWNTSNITNMYCTFSCCHNLTSLDVSNWDVSNITDMSYMFYECKSLTSLDVSNWDTSNVTNMEYMFCYCFSLTSLDVSNWDTSKVENMDSMFCDCKSLTSLDVSNFDTSNVTNMSWMFAGYVHYMELTSIKGLDKLNTSKVTNMESMFRSCQSLTQLDVSNWDTSNVTNMSCMFKNCYNLASLNLTNWNINQEANIEYMFENSQALSKILCKQNVLSKIQNELLERSIDDPGSIICKDLSDSYDLSILQSKNWNCYTMTNKKVTVRSNSKKIKSRSKNKKITIRTTSRDK